MSYSQLIQKDSPAGFWSLDEGIKLLSGFGVIGTVSGSGPYTSTISSLDSRDVEIGDTITATAGSPGTLGSGTVTVTGITSTSIVISSANIMTAGSVTNVIRKSSTSIKSHGFITDANKSKLYSGTYSSVVDVGDFKSILPIVYGGKSSISILNSGVITIPSLYKMSLYDSGNPSSIEFWIKISSSSSTEKVIMYKGDPGDPEIKISLINDYLVYTIGTSSNKKSVSVNIDSINKPLHIVASYSKSEISLTVNGVSKSKSLYNHSSYFNATYINNDFKFQKPSGIDILQIDSIALYSYVMTRQQVLKHFVYGCGYSIPTEFVDKNNGVYYNFSMDGHQDIKKYEFGGSNPWSITQSNNCVVYNNVLTIKPKQEPLSLFRDGYGSQSDIDSRFSSSSEYRFDANSYLSIEDIGSIFPVTDSGWLFKFTKNGTPSIDETLFILTSLDTDNSIEFVNTSSGIKAFINSDTASTLVTSSTDTSFYVGFYVIDSSNINLIYVPNTGSPVITSVALDIPLSLSKTDLRIGSADYWTEGENDEAEKNLVTIVSTQYLTKIIGIHKDNSLLYSTKANIEGSSFKHYYTATPNYLEKRFKVQSYATARIDVPLQSLAEPNVTYPGASRLEFGHPELSESLLVSVSGTTTWTADLVGDSINDNIITTSQFKGPEVISERTITDEDWLNKTSINRIQDGSNYSDLLQFDLTLKTNDLIDQPPYLNYFRLFSYPVIEDGNNKYLTCNASPGGNPAKIYYSGNEVSVPDLQEYPFFYNGNKSGIKIKNSYVKITQDYAFPSKVGHITAAQSSGSDTIFTITDNQFVSTNKIVVSEVYSTTQWNQSTPLTISSVSGNDVTVPLNSSSFYTYTTNENYQGNMSIASGIQTVSFMTYIPSTTTSADIINVGGSQMSLSSTTLSLTGATIYVNGFASSTIKTDSWNHITFVFNTPIYVTDLTPKDIILGNVSGTSEFYFYIDQLMIFDKKFTAKTVTNLYNLFSGDFQNTVYSTGPTLIDDNGEKTLNDSTQLCKIITDTSSLAGGSFIYTELKGESSPQTVTLNYLDTEIGKDISTTLEKTFTTGSQYMYITSSNNLKAGSPGSYLQVNGFETDYYITDIKNEDVSIAATAGRVASSKNTAILTFANNTLFPLLDEKDKVYIDTKGIIASDAKITKIDSANNKITISCAKGKVINASFTDIVKFKKVMHKLTFNTTVDLSTIPTYGDPVITKLDLGSQVVFDNYTQNNNELLNNKLKVDRQYIENGDYIVLKPATGTPELWTVDNVTTANPTGLVDTDIYTTTKTVTVQFTKQSFTSGTVYMDNQDLNVAVNNTTAFKWNGSALVNFAKNLQDRVIAYTVKK